MIVAGSNRVPFVRNKALSRFVGFFSELSPPLRRMRPGANKANHRSAETTARGGQFGANGIRSRRRRRTESSDGPLTTLESASGSGAPRGDNKNGASGIGVSFFSRPLAWYSHKLDTHPIATKCLTSGFIAGSGDLLCQYIVSRNAKGAGACGKNEEEANVLEPDLFRTGRFAVLGFAFAPLVHLIYGRLATHLPGTSPAQVLKRLAVDQGLFAPLFLPSFCFSLMTLEGRPPGETSERVADDYSDVLVANWCLWIPAQAVNFRFVPVKFQVLFGNVVEFVWSAYISWKTQDADDDADILCGVETLAESRV